MPAREIDDVAGFAEHAGGAAGDLAAGFGEQDPAAAALDQLDAELLFQLLDLHRERRLGHRALLRRLAEMLQPGDGIEIAELLERDHRSDFVIPSRSLYDWA